MHTAYSPNGAGDPAAVLNGRHLDLAIFQTALLKIPLLNFQVFSRVMAFKAIFFFTLLILEKCICKCPFGGNCVSYRKKKKNKNHERKSKKQNSQKKYIYTHLYINLKTLYKWVVIYKMLTLREKNFIQCFEKKKKRKKTFKKGQHTDTTSNF